MRKLKSGEYQLDFKTKSERERVRSFIIETMKKAVLQIIPDKTDEILDRYSKLKFKNDDTLIITLPIAISGLSLITMTEMGKSKKVSIKSDKGG